MSPGIYWFYYVLLGYGWIVLPVSFIQSFETKENLMYISSLRRLLDLLLKVHGLVLLRILSKLFMENGFEWTYRIDSLWLKCLQSQFLCFLKWSLSMVLTILLIKFSPNVWSEGKFLMHSVKIWIAWFPRKIQKAIKLIVRKSFLLCHDRQSDSELDKLNERRKLNVLKDSCGTTIWLKKLSSDNTYDHGPHCCQRLFTRSKSSNCLPASQGYEHCNNFYNIVLYNPESMNMASSG